MQALAQLFERHGRAVQLGADQVVYARGSDLTHVWRLQAGRVLLHSSSLAGREIGFDILEPHDLLGIVPVLQSRVAGVDATTLVPCDLLAMDRAVFIEALLADLAVTHETLQIVATSLSRRTKQAEELALYAVRGRLARYVIALAEQQVGTVTAAARIRLTLSQKIMAAMAGISRETLNRQFRAWIEAGIVALDGRELLILRPDDLRAFAGVAYD